jgi:hypothetical protein
MRCVLECGGLTALCLLLAAAMIESGGKPPHSKF